ncbi:16S rRNA (cytosine(967)-C(5))-methyltransferase RsmB [Acinetobacter larvae]|uniref:16S rRNA (cytosine(967)-C(5))-methyltransferase n=1 Tax=Acinetobacter larvae TaxID=1789224 RepID=A0A1B2LVH9_9GAMM|nr:16S rRNA (cytosine(967)-C(5))-methyltransferase RsmB [Acinetobacter larvae]AOA56926.1 16S rRNA (cytosine(967)-C(5))-methyltransferase [Acinetobacter larvae]
MNQPLSSSKRNLRAQLVTSLLAVQQGRSLQSILSHELAQVPSKDRALFHELLLGTLRQWHALKNISLPLLSKPLNNPTVESCIYLGMYQLLMTRTAPHAAISETVEACKQLGFAALSGVVNAILRRVSRETEAFQQALNATHGLPSWLAKRLKRDWPEHFPALCQQLKQPTSICLRINQRKIGRDAYLTLLHAQDIAAHAVSWIESAIVLDQNVQITSLPGFEKGWFAVQDLHAQLASQLLCALDQKVVLDACAAPGGKTAHLLEKYIPKQLIAIDSDEQRLQRVQENLTRLALHEIAPLSIQCADATTWQAEQLLDAILLDAPCSATGVLRRHPDIRLLRQSSDIEPIVQLQSQILEQLWSQLKVGGQLLYITCSILKAENEQQMQNFFAKHADAQEIKIAADWGIAQQYGRQLLPLEAYGDGFYYCLISKIA